MQYQTSLQLNKTGQMSKWKKIILILPGLLAAFVLFTLCGLIPNIIKGNGYPILSILLTLLVFPLTLLLIWFLNSRINQLSLAQVIGNKNRYIKPFLIGLGIGVTLFFASLIVLSFTSEFSFRIHYAISISSIFSVLFTALTVAFFEEFIFRGFVFITLWKTTNRFWIAAIVSSLLFSVIHYQSFMQDYFLIPLLNVFLGGILLCLLYVTTRSILGPIGFHFAFNSFQNLDLFYLTAKLDLANQEISEKAFVYLTIFTFILIIAIISIYYKKINQSFITIQCVNGSEVGG